MLFSWLLACATVGTLQTAETTGRGGVQVALEPAAWHAGYQGVGVTLPYAAMSARYGVAPGFDLGLRLGTSGAEMMGKGQIVRGPPFSLALQGSVGGYGLGFAGQGASFLVAQAGPMAGIWLGPHELVLAPKVHDWAAFAHVADLKGSGHVLSVGTSVGFALRVSPRVRILPEGAWVAPVFTAGTTSFLEGGSAPVPPGGLMSQYTCSFLFDLGPRPTRARTGR